MADYRERALDALIPELMKELPALLVVGPRATGKTTTAARHSATVVRLDRPAEAVAFEADADAALHGLIEPVLLDEWQAVPQVLGAVKRAVDSGERPGRFVLTGSVRADMDAPTWPGTGRLVRLALFGMTVGERLGRPRTVPFIDRLVRGEALKGATDGADLRGYVELALQSGFPEPALALSDQTRQRWLEAYVDQIITRDAMELDGRRDPDKLRRYFEAYALSSAGVPDDKTLFDAAGVNRKTAQAYEQLLVNLMVAERVPAWASNRLKRLVRAPKRYLCDAGLLVGGLRLDVTTVLRDGDLLGRLIDTFVAAQVRAELTTSKSRGRLYHLRTQGGRHEIDLLVELGAGRVVGIEVKATSAPDRRDARHLLWLRDRLGARFVGGVVLHIGPSAYEIDERVQAAPISALWA